jgi:hypothetical protein
MYVGGAVLLRNFPFMGEGRLAVLTRLENLPLGRLRDF